MASSEVDPRMTRSRMRAKVRPNATASCGGRKEERGRRKDEGGRMRDDEG